MNRKTIALVCLSLFIAVSPALALNPGNDVLGPAAVRATPWVTDLYVMNPGDATVSVEVFWLVRDRDNTAPTSITFDLPPGDTEILDDVILNDFELAEGFGAFRVEAGDVVVVNSRIYAVVDSDTLGQGFEGVPVWAATAAGQSTSAVGLTVNSVFRSNIYALSGADGATVNLELVDPSGARIGNLRTLELDTYEPYLRNIVDVMNTGDFANGTLLISVSSGSAVVGASKVDNGSGDPTTLESATSGGGGSLDGTYQFAIYDSFAFASGGNLFIAAGIVDAINGTYVNFDKGNGECTSLFFFGPSLGPTPVGDFVNGVEFSETYPADEDSGFDGGDMLFTVTFTMDGASGFSGTVDAVGSNFSDEDLGCNGTFPTLDLDGGKSN